MVVRDGIVLVRSFCFDAIAISKLNRPAERTHFLKAKVVKSAERGSRRLSEPGILIARLHTHVGRSRISTTPPPQSFYSPIACGRPTESVLNRRRRRGRYKNCHSARDPKLERQLVYCTTYRLCNARLMPYHKLRNAGCMNGLIVFTHVAFRRHARIARYAKHN